MPPAKLAKKINFAVFYILAESVLDLCFHTEIKVLLYSMVVEDVLFYFVYNLCFDAS